MRAINKEIGFEIQSFETYEKTKQINDLSIAKLKEIFDSIDIIFQRFLKDDEMKFTFSFSPKSICENICQIENHEEIAQRLQLFKDELRLKYMTIKDHITAELKKTEDIEAIYKIEY